MRFLAAVFLLLASALAATSSYAQSTLLQAGTFVGGHAPMYTGPSGQSQAVVQDSGPAGGGAVGVGFSEMLLTARGTGTAPYASQGTGPLGTNFCDYDAPINNATGYHFLCWSANAQGGGLIAYGAGGAASQLPLSFNVNGVVYQFPFSTSGVVGPAVSVVNDAACWNNTQGTLLKDCGAFVTVGGNNTWTGTNNFTGTFQISSITQTFPASGNLLGTSDVQTITNKHINAGQLDSGTLSAVVMPAFTGDITSSAGTVATTIAANAVTNSKLATAAQNTLKGAATSTAIADLAVPSCSTASSALQWTTNTGFQCATITSNSAGFGLNLSGGIFSISQTQPPFAFDVPINLGLTATVGASALTINVVGANGSAPSATNPVMVPFRSTTLATGTPVWVSITSALSIVVPSSATLGTSNSVPFRIWLFAAYNAGVPELVVATCSNTTNVFPCAAWETTGKTTTTITSGSATAGVPYATAGVSSDSLRIIGYAEYSAGLATAGSWASTPTTLQLFGPGVKKPGDVVQTVLFTSSSTTAVSSSSLTATALATSITPTSAVNFVRAESASQAQCAASCASILVAQIYRGSGVTVVGSTATAGGTTANSNASTSLPLYALDKPNTTSSTQYGVYIYDAINSSVWTHQSTATSVGANTGSLTLTEIQGFDLREPVNDNIDPGVFALTG